MPTPARAVAIALIFALGSCATPAPPAPANVVNDITQLNPITVERVAAPETEDELAALVRDHDGPISIGGGRFSQGGQTACTGCLFIDMRRLNHILAVDEQNRTITVQAGATWRQIQEAIDPKNLSPEIMQSYFNFTVGGSLSVNCHGDYVGYGPIIQSVRSIRIVLADGSIVTASRDQNRDIFDAAIGGYGGVGVIVEATLDLAANTRLARQTYRMRVGDYAAWHQANVLNQPNAVLESAVIYPRAYRDIAATVSTTTDAPVTIPDRLGPLGAPDAMHRALLNVVTYTPLGPFIHQHIYDPMTMRPAVAWRNYLASHDAYGLEPASRTHATYALQEYFVPTDRFDAFVPAMAHILNAHHANVLNIAIRHTRADHETLLAWAKTDVYSFVLYYEQGTSQAARDGVDQWTRELVDAALAQGGSFYLPYQIHATRDQFLAAYPRAGDYFAVKRRVDPTYKFRNRLWEAYYAG